MSKTKAAVKVSKSNSTIADHVMDWMAENCPSWTVDCLLTHPDQAILMARGVNKLLCRPNSESNIHEVCRVALNERKRGNIKRERV